MNILSLHMGNDFNELSPLLQLAHTGSKRLEGKVTVKRGGILANIICSVFRFPGENPDANLVVECSHSSKKMQWLRYFDGHKMSSTFVAKGDYLIEQLGPLSLYFKASNVHGSLEYTFSRTELLGIPLPAILSPKIVAREQEINGKYLFLVRVDMFMIGFILSYGGELAVM